MTKGTTKSGISFKIDERVRDDVRLLYILTKIQRPDVEAMEASNLLMTLLNIIFGDDEGAFTFMNAVASANNGICNTDTMMKELNEILEACKIKNSSSSHKSSTRARKN
jgi:hypothetical protein